MTEPSLRDEGATLLDGLLTPLLTPGEPPPPATQAALADMLWSLSAQLAELALRPPASPSSLWAADAPESAAAVALLLRLVAAAPPWLLPAVAALPAGWR